MSTIYVDRYSRVVAWLKVSLPLFALAILSSLFLVSRAIDPPATVPFADDEVQERISSQQVTGPYFSSVSANGDHIEMIAQTVKTGQEIGTHIANDVEVTVDFVGGLQAVLVANEADVNMAKDLSDLTGDVVVTTSQGHILMSDRMLVRISAAQITSPGPVEGLTPWGTINAGAMQFFAPEEDQNGQLFFTNGVKLVYDNLE